MEEGPLSNETVMRLHLPPFCINTSVSDDMRFSGTDALVVFLYSIAFLVSVVGNGTMFFILLRNLRHRQCRVVMLLLHMNLADLLTTAISLPKDIVHTSTIAWHGTDWLCRVCRLFDVFGVYLSANLLVCVSFDRFLAIMFPSYVRHQRNAIRGMLVAAWTLAFVSSVPQVFLFRVASHPCFPWYHQCISRTLLGETSAHVDLYNTMLNAVEAYFVPLFVICACYSAILLKLGREQARPPTTGDGQLHIEQTSPNNRRCRTTTEETKRRRGQSLTELIRLRAGRIQMQKAKSRTLRMTIVVVAAFLVCWTPYYAMATLHFVDMDYTTGRRKGAINVPTLLMEVLNVFACFNSSINPYLYGCFSFDLKMELRLLLRSLTGANSSERQKICEMLTHIDIEQQMELLMVVKPQTTAADNNIMLTDSPADDV